MNVKFDGGVGAALVPRFLPLFLDLSLIIIRNLNEVVCFSMFVALVGEMKGIKFREKWGGIYRSVGFSNQI